MKNQLSLKKWFEPDLKVQKKMKFLIMQSDRTIKLLNDSINLAL